MFLLPSQMPKHALNNRVSVLGFIQKNDLVLAQRTPSVSVSAKVVYEQFQVAGV
jgi:hypothetical protein